MEWGAFLAIFIAIAIGWLLGKFPLAKYWLNFQNRAWRKSYMEGIHLLLSEEPDQAVEEFIHAWRVNSENFDLHNEAPSHYPAPSRRWQNATSNGIWFHSRLALRSTRNSPLFYRLAAAVAR